MPPVEEVFKQFLLLGSKLRTAARDVATAASPGRRLKGASGTVIMKDLWADPELKKLTAGCEAYLYLWVHCATKTHNEAVVEAMGSKWDAAARDARHLHLKPATEEAVIAWSAPHPWHPEAAAFCTNALNRHARVNRKSETGSRSRGTSTTLMVEAEWSNQVGWWSHGIKRTRCGFRRGRTAEVSG